ncbi:MAG: adenylyl-sulfate kinase [Burkholderiales bacterium]|nr:adenylyl-sulfate kinase [Burkholderiales bacterium]
MHPTMPDAIHNPVATLWLTGLSGAGKSTLAQAAREALHHAGIVTCLLDGDIVRAGLCSDLGFSPRDRRENIRRVAEVARLMNEAGVVVIASLISPLHDDRATARAIIGDPLFREVHIATSLAVCEQRDPKGLYAKARRGEIPEFTGISAPYEAPISPALRIDTAHTSIPDAVHQLLGLIGISDLVLDTAPSVLLAQ